MTPCLNMIMLYSALFPLFLAQGLIFEVELFMFIDQHLSLSSSPNFTSFLFILYPFSCTIFGSLLSYLGIHRGMMEVLIRGMKCTTTSLKYYIVDSEVL